MQSYYNIKENSSQISYVDTEFNTSWKNKIFSSNEKNLDYLFRVLEEVGIPMEISYKNGTVTLDKK